MHRREQVFLADREIEHIHGSPLLESVGGNERMRKQRVQRQITADPTVLDCEATKVSRQSLARTSRRETPETVRRRDVDRICVAPHPDRARSQFLAISICEQNDLFSTARRECRIVPVRMAGTMRNAAHDAFPILGVRERYEPRAHGTCLRGRHGAASSHSRASGNTPWRGRMRSTICGWRARSTRAWGFRLLRSIWVSNQNQKWAI